MIRFNDVTFSYDDSEDPPLIDGVNLTLEAGTMHCVLGENGCGKTTLMKLACGLLSPRSGQVEPDPSHHRDGMTYLPQTLNFPGRLLVSDILEFYRSLRPTRACSESLYERLGLATMRRQPYGTLSGGQKRRVGLYVALSKPADHAFLDEPYAGLSPDLVDALHEWMVDAAWESVLFATHLWDQAERLSDRGWRLDAGRLTLLFPHERED